MNTSSHTRTGALASVLVSGQDPSRVQRKGRYTPESMAHPAKMLPAIAAQIIAAYTEPGDLVIDPMCGIGTTLVEAVHQGRQVTGMEYEAHFAQMTAGNLRHARTQGATGTGQVVHGDARNIATALADLTGTAALVLTSLPTGRLPTGRYAPAETTAVERSTSPTTATPPTAATSPTARPPNLIAGFGQILTGCAALLRPGGVIAVTVRPSRVAGELVDLPGQVITVAEDNGLVRAGRLAALLCGLRDGQIVTRASFFQMIESRRLREHGIPAMATAREDLLLFQERTELLPGGDW